MPISTIFQLIIVARFIIIVGNWHGLSWKSLSINMPQLTLSHKLVLSRPQHL
jgi:hypothetical protein